MLLACIAALLVGAALGAILVQYMIPNLGEIQTASLELYVDNETIVNATYTGNVDWGVCEPGYTYFFENMTVLNTGNIALTAYIISYGLPVGWSFGWQANNTEVSAGSKAMGELNLTIPAGATMWPDCGFYLRGE